MIRRFRTRLLASAMGVVALAIALSLAIAGTSFWRIESQRLDNRLCLEARRLADEPDHLQRMPDLKHDLQGKLDMPRTDTIAVTVTPGKDDFADGWLMSAMGQPDMRWPANMLPGSDSREQPRCLTSSFYHNGETWRGAHFQNRDHQAIVAVESASASLAFRQTMTQSLLMITPLCVALTLAAAWMLTRLGLRPIQRVGAAMQQVKLNELTLRLDTSGEDEEFRILMDSYNQMLDRLQVSYSQAARFSADAAHELKTPLTILLGRLEHLQQHIQDESLTAELASMQEEIHRLTFIVRKLLLLAQADAGAVALHPELINLSDLLSLTVADMTMLAEDPQLEAHIDPELLLMADRTLLTQAINNLSSNALRYTPQGGWIEVDAFRREGGIEVIFSNQCEPLPAKERQKLFNRFHRGNGAHSRTVDGTGLGLSLVKAIIEAHGGRIDLLPAPDNIMRISLWLP